MLRSALAQFVWAFQSYIYAFIPNLNLGSAKNFRGIRS